MKRKNENFEEIDNEEEKNDEDLKSVKEDMTDIHMQGEAKLVTDNKDMRYDP